MPNQMPKPEYAPIENSTFPDISGSPIRQPSRDKKANRHISQVIIEMDISTMAFYSQIGKACLPATEK